MAHVELRVGVEHHLTLAHFELMDDAKWAAVNEVLTDIMLKVKRPPTGHFGDLAMFGRYKNVHGRKVVSPYVDHLRNEMIRQFNEKGIIWSDTFDWNPHVSKPLIDWHTGAPVPFATFMSLVWKKSDKPLTHYDLG